MIRDEYTKTLIIESHSPEEVTEQLNKVLKEYRNCDVKFTKNYHPSIGHYVDVEWTEVTVIPESVRDEFHLKGITHYCGECPYYHINDDRRMKYSYCEKGNKVWCEREACEQRYIEIKEGE